MTRFPAIAPFAATPSSVFAEKLRALGQRTRPRDLYDVVNLYRKAELHDARDTVTVVLERKCAYKNVPVPTLAAVATAEKISDLRADWEAMLAHQLPVLPPIGEFIDALEGLFAWLGGAEPARLEPVPCTSRAARAGVGSPPQRSHGGPAGRRLSKSASPGPTTYS